MELKFKVESDALHRFSKQSSKIFDAKDMKGEKIFL